MGALLLAIVEFQRAVLLLAAMLILVLLLLGLIRGVEFGHPKKRAALREVWAVSSVVRSLSIARVFLFAARDAWFVVGVPIYLHTVLTQSSLMQPGSSFFTVGAFMASWVIAYGIVQAMTPHWFRSARQSIVGAYDNLRRWNRCTVSIDGHSLGLCTVDLSVDRVTGSSGDSRPACIWCGFCHCIIAAQLSHFGAQ